MVFWRICRSPIVMADMEAVEVLLAAGSDFRHKGLRRETALLGSNHDRGAVHVVGADKVHDVAAHAFMTNPNVGLDVFHDVTHMEGAVGIRKRRGHEKFALFHVVLLLWGENADEERSDDRRLLQEALKIIAAKTLASSSGLRGI